MLKKTNIQNTCIKLRAKEMSEYHRLSSFFNSVKKLPLSLLSLCPFIYLYRLSLKSCEVSG